MEPNMNAKKDDRVIKRIVICVVVLVIGVIGMLGLAKLKKPPAEVKLGERPIRVEAIRAVFEEVPVLITGYGEIRALDTVSIAPEISGKIVRVHPRLEVGEMIAKGEIVFEVDARDYDAAEKQAGATADQWKNTVIRLKREYAIEKERLKTLERNRKLSQAEHERTLRLFKKDNVGTRSGVDAAEQLFNNAADRADQMRQAVLLFPIRIKEAENSLTSAIASREITAANLERCIVRSPFMARVKKVSLEKDQYVSPGFEAVIVANDSVLEISVPLDSRDARTWLHFSDKGFGGKAAWFNELVPVKCRIRWTEDLPGNVWTGRLSRVLKFDRETRTLTVAIRFDAHDALSGNKNGLPLVEGMFCAVEIPGKTLHKVIRLPRWAVSFENTVYTSVNNRLKTIHVTVARIEGEDTFVSDGISPGAIVVTTRLIDPLENSLLKVTNIRDSSSINKVGG